MLCEGCLEILDYQPWCLCEQCGKTLCSKCATIHEDRHEEEAEDKALEDKLTRKLYFGEEPREEECKA